MTSHGPELKKRQDTSLEESGVRMDRSLFKFILRYSKWEQLRIAPLVLGTMVVYFFSLDLPKTIINNAIQGKRFPSPDSTAPIFRIVIELPQFLGGATLRLFDGIPLERIPYLFALSLIFMGLIIFNGALKFQINTMKGWMGERMLRRQPVGRGAVEAVEVAERDVALRRVVAAHDDRVSHVVFAIDRSTSRFPVACSTLSLAC